ncbi:MAG: HlyD family efflux transporter periplasmic adaptor subunit [Bacteroidota bacterium]
MLNISTNKVNEKEVIPYYRSFQEVIDPQFARVLTYWLVGILLAFIVMLFLPWTQNIQAKGTVTTLRPEQRPQTIHSTIAGRIEKWYVTEGDTVRRGDTIVFLSEIKDDYFDPELVERTSQQVDAKEDAITAYQDKASALSGQIAALRQNRDLKLEQASNKIQQSRFKVISDSAAVVAAEIDLDIANTQYQRWDTLNKLDIKSRTDLENKLNSYRKAQAEVVEKVNKLMDSRQELLNARIAYNNITNEFNEKLAKAESDRQSALSNQFGTQADVAKLKNKRTNLEQRVSFRYITAPQDGFINKALKPGIGETVKEGEAVVSIIPLGYELAAEIFVRPVDLPLVQRGEEVRLQFDGWPAIVFSGWPNASFGTFGGLVFAVETNISSNGRYRVLIQPDPKDEVWPGPLRVGSGVEAFALLNDVPLWYEIWRQLNGFPADFYTGENAASGSSGKSGDDKSKSSGSKK